MQIKKFIVALVVAATSTVGVAGFVVLDQGGAVSAMDRGCC